MRNAKKYLSAALAAACAVLSPVTVYAGWIADGTGWRYEKDDGSCAASEWILDHDRYYYMDGNGRMAVSTTTPDGYLVRDDGIWSEDRQIQGGYVLTPYDNFPYRYDPDWQRYIFNESTDYAVFSDNQVLAAVRGIIPVTELSEKNLAVYHEVRRFLTGFDYGASDYEKAKRVYEEITGRAVYREGSTAAEDNEAYGILVLGQGKCIGFARAYKLLANAVGLTCGFRTNGVHMWNGVEINGEAVGIDSSTVGTSPEFYLDVSGIACPVCGFMNRFAAREAGHPCPGCGSQVSNPKLN